MDLDRGALMSDYTVKQIAELYAAVPASQLYSSSFVVDGGDWLALLGLHADDGPVASDFEAIAGISPQRRTLFGRPVRFEDGAELRAEGEVR